MPSERALRRTQKWCRKLCVFWQGPLTIWTYHSFFCKYNLGPSLKIEYLKSGWEYQRASFIGLKFGISRITRLWFQVFKWLHLWMVWIWKSGFECKFPAPEGIMKNTKKHPTLSDHCDPTTCSKMDYKVPMERGYPYLSFGTFGSKLGSLLWPHWALIQPEANHKMKNHGVISPYPLEVPGQIYLFIGYLHWLMIMIAFLASAVCIIRVVVHRVTNMILIFCTC